MPMRWTGTAVGLLVATLIQSSVGLADDPFGLADDRAATTEDQVELLERAIEDQLDITEGRALAPSKSSVDPFQTGRELAITGRRLDTLKTWQPQNQTVPLLERQLDRAQRPLSTGRPPPVQRDPLPPSRRLGAFSRR